VAAVARLIEARTQWSTAGQIDRAGRVKYCMVTYRECPRAWSNSQ
jgi:hypothetical protein